MSPEMLGILGCIQGASFAFSSVILIGIARRLLLSVRALDEMRRDIVRERSSAGTGST